MGLEYFRRHDIGYTLRDIDFSKNETKLSINGEVTWQTRSLKLCTYELIRKLWSSMPSKGSKFGEFLVINDSNPSK